MIKDYSCIKLDGETSIREVCQVVEEVPLSIFINGRHFVTAVISPELRKEFVCGHLFSERIVGGLDEIESLNIEGNVARALIKNPMRALFPRRPIVSGCGGVASYLDESKLPRISSDLLLRVNDLQEAMKAISLSEIHVATGGVHSVGLFDKNKAICIIEDIGRHNALDKALGLGLASGVDWSRTFVACTGRISSDMAMKCVVAGIPLIVSRGATTSLAISIAERTGLSIIGFLRGKRLSIFSNGERVAID